MRSPQGGRVRALGSGRDLARVPVPKGPKGGGSGGGGVAVVPFETQLSLYLCPSEWALQYHFLGELWILPGHRSREHCHSCAADKGPSMARRRLQG